MSSIQCPVVLGVWELADDYYIRASLLFNSTAEKEINYINQSTEGNQFEVISFLNHLHRFWYRCEIKTDLNSISTTNEHLYLLEWRAGRLYLARHAQILICLRMQVYSMYGVCMSPASSHPTLIWADGCHGSGSHLLHSSINSIDLDTGCTAATDSGGKITDPNNISNNGTLEPKSYGIWCDCKIKAPAWKII